jgi:NAD(P)-dependent dehydrogenase (short-subunit alcohol dehydrogenase family)
MINIMGAFNSIQAFLPLAAPGAKLFNTSSGIGHWQPNDSITGDFAYGAAKAAAIKMFDYVAFENPGLHVVNFQPGIIATGINPDITVAFDTGMFCHPRCKMEADSFSGIAWSFCCMACFEGS